MKFSTKFVAATRELSTFERHIPAPALRKAIELPALDKAELTICGLGFYELYVNGARLTRGLLSPYISNPDDILYYDSYDLAPYLAEGKNVIGILLGNGMQDCYGGEIWDFEKAVFRSAPKVALAFEGENADGKVEFDATSGFVCTESPIYVNDLRVGEFYDATKELGDWLKADYDASAWRETLEAETPRGICRIADIDPILPTMELSPVSVKPGKIALQANPRKDLPICEIPEDEGGEGFIYDFGVNAAGLCRLHIKDAKPGQKLVLQFAEKLAKDADGNEGLDLRGMSFLPRRYNHRDVYICKGGDEVWMPSFTYHGFEYVLVTGITAEQATPELLTYVVMNTALKERSTFRASDEMLNKLWDAAIVSDLANFYHFPTDCPHREKNGWTGDAALSAEQMLMALTPERNFREWMNNIRLAMNDAGAVPGIVPTSGWGFAWGNGPAWDIVMANLPYYTYIYRGDLTMARENVTALMRYINYITARRDERGLVHIGLGDWCPPSNTGVKAPLEFTDTVVCIDFCRKSAILFGALGLKAQKAFAETVGEELLAAAREHLIVPGTGSAAVPCQTTQAMGIFYGIFEEQHRGEAFAILMSLLEKQNWHTDCGIQGIRVLFHVLSEFGQTELAYRMLVDPEYPSYGHQIASGSTSVWEQFKHNDEAPNSRNHHFFCDYISWFMKNLVGINVNPNGDDAKRIRLAPRFVDALTSAEGTHETLCGKLSASWRRDGDAIVYTFAIPEGITADILLESSMRLDDGSTYRRLKGAGELRITKA